MNKTTTSLADSNLSPITNKYDFTVYFYVKDGNPNGDPDSDNRPRLDDRTRHGEVTAECLRRKIRNYVEMAMDGKDGNDIFVRSGEILDGRSVYNNITEEVSKEVKSKLMKDVRPILYTRYFDIRAFGGMLSTGLFSGDPDGQLRGPVQFGMSRSIDPIDLQQITITRCCVTDKKDTEKERTMGGRWITPFGLYKVNGSIMVPYAEKSGFSEIDLNLLFDAITNMFENDKSTGRPDMGVVKFVVFKHNSRLGSFPSWKLTEAVIAKKKDGVINPRDVNDYTITIDETLRKQLDGKVEIIEKI